MSRGFIPDAVRKKVAIRANHRCEYCGIPEAESFYKFQIDHIISLKHEGQDDVANLAWSCFPCNKFKGADIGNCVATQ